jgi:hypothetical protein
MPFRLRLLTAGLLLVATSAAAGGQRLPRVACHVDYGGEARVIEAVPTHDPYAVAPVAIGSYFLFRVVFEHPARALPAIKVYTYADRNEGPTPIHVGHHPYPPSGSRRYGFTGQQFVYEPVRDGELSYWCELRRGRQ